MIIQLKENSYLGTLIVFEGTDGSGKTSLKNELEKCLKNNNINFYSTKMPSNRVRSLNFFNDYDKSKDDKTRNLLNIENLTVFVSGDRLIVLDSEIVPYLKKGYVVLCDRYCYTGIARCNTNLIKKIACNFIKPDIVFYTYCNEKILKQRVMARKNEKNNFYDEKDVENQLKVYNLLSKSQNFVKIDTEKQFEECSNFVNNFALNTIKNKKS